MTKKSIEGLREQLYEANPQLKPNTNMTDENTADDEQNGLEAKAEDIEAEEPSEEETGLPEDLFEPRPIDEIDVPTRGDPDEWPAIKALAREVDSHGEVHATVEEHGDEELEVRQGTAFFNFADGVLEIKTEVGHANLIVKMDRIVDFHKPHNPWH